MLENFLFLSQPDWRIIIQKGYTIALDRHTGYQYVLQKITCNSKHLLQIYRERMQCLIANTPQIILGNKNQHFFIDAFIQYAPFTIDKVIRKTLSQKFISKKIKVILNSAGQLVKKYGFFRVSHKMLRVTNTMSILIWINDNFSSTHRQYPLSSTDVNDDYKTMINNILTIILQQDFKSLLNKLRKKIDEQKNINFEKFCQILQNITNCKQKNRNQRLPSFIRNNNSHQNTIIKNRTCSNLHETQLTLNKNTNGLRLKLSEYINTNKHHTRSMLLFKSMSPKMNKINIELKSQDENISPCSVGFTKNNIRNSGKGKSQASTTNISSGSIKQKLIQNIIQEQCRPFEEDDEKKVKQSQKIHPQAVVSQNNKETGTPCSCKNMEKKKKSNLFCQFQKQFNLVFNSCLNEQVCQEIMPHIMMELERDLNHILFT